MEGELEKWFLKLGSSVSTKTSRCFYGILLSPPSTGLRHPCSSHRRQNEQERFLLFRPHRGFHQVTPYTKPTLSPCSRPGRAPPHPGSAAPPAPLPPRAARGGPGPGGGAEQRGGAGWPGGDTPAKSFPGLGAVPARAVPSAPGCAAGEELPALSFRAGPGGSASSHLAPQVTPDCRFRSCHPNPEGLRGEVSANDRDAPGDLNRR